MKKQLATIGVIIVLLAIGLSGCTGNEDYTSKMQLIDSEVGFGSLIILIKKNFIKC